MASSTSRVRLPSISELTSSTSSYIPSLSPRIKEEKEEVPPIETASYKYPIKHSTPNYVLSTNNAAVPPPPPPASSTPASFPKSAAPVTPNFEAQQHPSQYQSPLAQPQYQSPPSQYPYHPAYQQHSHVTHSPTQQHQQQQGLRPIAAPGPPPPAPAPAPAPAAYSYGGYYQPVYYPQQQPQQGPIPPHPHMHSTQQQHIHHYPPHGNSATGAQFAVPEVINKPNNKCHRCGTTETPEWRRGPNGVRTLCNACGLFHAKLVKRKGAALAAEEVLNNKVCKGKNGRRISIKKHNTENSLKSHLQVQQHQQLHMNEPPKMLHQGLPPIMGPAFPPFTVHPAMIRP
ncbi:biofilm regulator 1 [[Candida] anglica]|uniref:Biofilm regulator 1 n=1 Tax=[Candida] anglica TaxID=148631 RepID=A0ABP0EIN2_9ASCO